MPHKYIYHLVQEAKWRDNFSNGGTYLPSTYQQDGFIHATAEAELLLPVANHFYTDVPGTFLCLRIDVDLLTSEVKYEAAAPVGEKTAHSTQSAGEEAGESVENAQEFPHIYGPINPAAVVAELLVKRTMDGSFISVEGLC
ncbi:unnamed protein product [Choristocarpus tenellus]